jgi:Cu/Ag efflux pump CusA
MSGLVTSVGFVPMAVPTSAGADLQHPLATAAIVALVPSTITPLLVMATVYGWLEERWSSRVWVASGVRIRRVTRTTDRT